MTEFIPSVAFIFENKDQQHPGERILKENAVEIFRLSQKEIQERPLDFIHFFHNHHPHFTFVEVMSSDSVQFLDVVGRWNLTRSSQVVPIVEDERLQQQIREIPVIRPFADPLRRDGIADFLQQRLLSPDAASRKRR